MLANERFLGKKLYCIVDQKEIPEERAKKKSNTCSDECSDLLSAMRRVKRTDHKVCRYCHKPSTPSTRAAWSQYRKWVKEHSDLAFPAQWKIVSAAGMTLPDFTKAVAQASRLDMDIQSGLFEYDMGAVKPLPAELPAELARTIALLEAANARTA